MKFIHKDNPNPTYSTPLTLLRENHRYEITRLSDRKVAFSDRKPRKDWRGWHGNFMVWDIKNKEVVRKVLDLSSCMPKASWQDSE